MKKIKIKKGDKVIVISGENKGTSGSVLKVLYNDNKAIVEGVNMVKRHTKPSQANQQGGILEREGKIHISNVLPVDPKTSKPSRVSRKKLEDGSSVRVTKRSGEILDTI